MNIDVAFDFTSDTPNYWNNFWDDGVLGGGGADPDAVSKTLQTYHQFLLPFLSFVQTYIYQE